MPSDPLVSGSHSIAKNAIEWATRRCLGHPALDIEMWSQCGARVRIPLEDCQPVKNSGVLRLALGRCASSRFAQDDK
jgi:hypothetical protein